MLLGRLWWLAGFQSGSAELAVVTAAAATEMTKTADFRAGGDFLVAIAKNIDLLVKSVN